MLDAHSVAVCDSYAFLEPAVFMFLVGDLGNAIPQIADEGIVMENTETILAFLNVIPNTMMQANNQRSQRSRRNPCFCFLVRPESHECRHVVHLTVKEETKPLAPVTDAGQLLVLTVVPSAPFGDHRSPVRNGL